jgi:hypothetical protein
MKENDDPIPDPQWTEITCFVPRRFIARAEGFCLEPEHLLRLLSEDFVNHPPKKLIIIEREPVSTSFISREQASSPRCSPVSFRRGPRQ